MSADQAGPSAFGPPYRGWHNGAVVGDGAHPESLGRGVGLGMGVQESLIPAAVAPMVSPDRRAFAYGLFTGIYGTAWVLGSIVIGVLVTVSLDGLVAFCVVSELAAIPLILLVRRRPLRRHRPDPA
jgi:MFS family permease